jgi:hypothetical protein
MFATVTTDTSDEHYTSSYFVSFSGLVGIGLTPPVVFAPPARMDDPDWLPCRVGASSYLPDGGHVAGRSRGMIVFLALDSCLGFPGRVHLGHTSRRGLRRGQIRGPRVATSRGAFLGKDPPRAAGQKVARSRACAGHCHCGSGVVVPAASALEFNTQQARQSKRGHFPPKALQVRRSRSRHPKIRCPRGISRDRSFRRNLWTPAYGDAVANVRSSQNFPEPKRNRGASRCPFTQRG